MIAVVAVLPPGRTENYSTARAKVHVRESFFQESGLHTRDLHHNKPMSQRHPLQNSHTMFVTTNILHREPIFIDPACARAAIESLYYVQEIRPCFVFGFVMMPDHCHLLMRAPEEGSISKIIGLFKRATSFTIGRGPI